MQKLQQKLAHFEILDGFMLKILAATTMLIDHTAVIFIRTIPEQVYMQMRIIGRISFPIFAFLLVQGFIHTRNKLNYLARIFGFGLAMIFGLSIFSTFGIQVPLVVNIFITLGIGFIAIWFIETFWATSKFTTVFFMVGLLLFADALHTDYGAYGIATIILFYVTRQQKIAMALGFTVLTILSVFADYVRYDYASLIQLYAVAAIPFLLMYNGQPGKYRFKYFFYFFYPLHFMALEIIRYFLYGY